MDEKYMYYALLEAKKAYKENEIPVGAIIVKNNKILAKAHNKREQNKKVSAHAELSVIEKASKKNKDWRLNECIMYTTLFPCPMCASAIQQSRIKRLVYLSESNNQCNSNISHMILNSSHSNHFVQIEKSSIKADILDVFFKELRKKNNVSRETYNKKS